MRLTISSVAVWLVTALLWPAASVHSEVLRYTIGPAVADIQFKVDHLGLFQTTGRFSRFNGTLDLDPAAPDGAKVDVTVDAGSVATGWADRDELLRSPDYLYVNAYPTLHFVGQAAVAPGGRQAMLDGDLTMRGITRPIRFTTQLIDQRKGADGAEIATFQATGDINRADYGITAGSGMISDRIAITIDANIRLQ